MRESKQESKKKKIIKENLMGDPLQSQEFLDPYDQDAIPPSQSNGLTRSSSPGQTFQRPLPSPEPAEESGEDKDLNQR